MPSFKIRNGKEEIVVRYLVVLRTTNSDKATEEIYNPLWNLASEVVELPSFWAERRRFKEGYVAFAFASKIKWEAAKLLIRTRRDLDEKVLLTCGANNISWHTNS